MDTNPITLIVGTGAAVLIARTFYESFNTSRGHTSAVLKKDSKTKRPSRNHSAASSKESNAREVDGQSGRSKRSSSASVSGSYKELANTLSLVDQKLDELVNEANSEIIVTRAASPATSLKLSQELSNKLLAERDHVDEEVSGKIEEIGSSNETATDLSSDGLSVAKTSGSVREGDDFIQLHACSHLPEDSTQKSQSGVHVSVDIIKKPESAVHVSVDVMQMAEAGRLADRMDQISQSLTKQLEGSAHQSERIEQVSDKGVLRLESTVYAKDHVEHVQGNAIQPHENSVREQSEIAYENIGQRSGSDGHSSERTPLSEHENHSALRRSSRSSERSSHSKHDDRIALHSPESGTHVSKHSLRVENCLENVMKLPESAPRLSQMSAHSAAGFDNVSEHSAHEKQPGSARVSDHSAHSDRGQEDAVHQPEINDQEVTGYSAADNALSEEENDSHNDVKITSSEIDQEIRRSIALESLKNTNEQLGMIVDEIGMRPETPAGQFDPEIIRAAVETLCAVYNEQQKYNKEAKNYLLQIRMEKDSMVANECEDPANMTSGAPFQEVFFNSFRRDNHEEDNTAQIIETMNEYLVGDDQNDDVDSNSAETDSNASDRTAEDETEEAPLARGNDVGNVEGESNTTTSSLTNSLVIYVKERNENDDSRTEGFEDEGFDVVSCVPNIFQNVIVRRILKD